MKYELFSKIALSTDLIQYNLKAGDIATIVDCHETKNSCGYSLEVFNALGETIEVLSVDESQIEPLNVDEILHIRHFEKIAA